MARPVADASIDVAARLDAFGHGTHLAGVIAGVAPDSRVINVKVADRDGATTLARLLAGIDWVVRHGDRDGLDVRVLNLAFGAEPDGSYRDDPLAYAVERAWDRGIVVVAAAGNGGARPRASTSRARPLRDRREPPTRTDRHRIRPDGRALTSRGSDTRRADVVPRRGIVSTRVAAVSTRASRRPRRADGSPRKRSRRRPPSSRRGGALLSGAGPQGPTGQGASARERHAAAGLRRRKQGAASATSPRRRTAAPSVVRACANAKRADGIARVTTRSPSSRGGKAAGLETLVGR